MKAFHLAMNSAFSGVSTTGSSSRRRDGRPAAWCRAGEFFLADREGDDRDVLGLDALVAEFLVERHVGVAVDGRDDGGLLAGRAELLDVGTIVCQSE
jgi:hypothetical protein